MSLHQFYSVIKKFWFEPGSPLPLGLFRICFGFVLLEYCFLMAPELITCLSDTNGILRIETLKNIFAVPVINLITLLPPGDGWIIVFFAVFVLSCICLTLGLFSRASIILVYLGLISIQHRNIYVHHSGDHLLILAAFYLMFAPIGAALSLDRVLKIWLSPTLPAREHEQVSLWAFKAYQIQFMLIYWQTSWAKIAAPTWWDGTALYYVFRHAEFSRFPVPIVPDNLFLLKIFTWSAILIEFCAWIFVWFKETRYPVLLSLVALHLGIDYAMNIPIFEHIMLASLVIFIPAEDLKKCAAIIRTWVRQKYGAPVFIQYNAMDPLQARLARTVKCLDILHRFQVIDTSEASSESSDELANVSPIVRLKTPRTKKLQVH